MDLIIRDNFNKRSWTITIVNSEKLEEMILGNQGGYFDVIVAEYKIPVSGSYTYYADVTEDNRTLNLNPIISGHNGKYILSLTFQAKFVRREEEVVVE